ncbi:hypothetical protein WJX73_002624 [Symbiochloris irregularis]|uniref:BHLH domain-containing protein n=1 Tax=Symbiochloris irregularis TaxID=706552 RepID=A0AAW1NI92_9CHLO
MMEPSERSQAVSQLVRRGSMQASGALSLSGCTQSGRWGEDDDEDDEGFYGLSDVSGEQQHKERHKRPHLQGRFSGRLETKEDEKRLADECRLLGPLLGGIGKRGDSSRGTLAKIVRSIASGQLREFVSGRESIIQDLEERRAQEEETARQLREKLERDNSALQAELDRVAAPRAAMQAPLKTESVEDQLTPTPPEARIAIASSTASTSALLSQSTICAYPASPSKGPMPSLPFQSPPGAQHAVPPSALNMHSAACPSAVPYSAEAAAPAPPSSLQLTAPLASNPALPTPEEQNEAQMYAKEAAQLQKFAQNLKAHANSWAAQSQTAFLGRPVKMQAACQAQSFQAKAISLEKAAEAQSLQAQAVAHAQAQAEAQAQAQRYVSHANQHAQAHNQATMRADHLQRAMDMGETKQVTEKLQLERQAHEHAQAQTQLVNAAHSLTQKATAHMHAQVTAQQQAHAAAAESHHYDAQAQVLQAEAGSVAGPLGPSPPSLPPADQNGIQGDQQLLSMLNASLSSPKAGAMPSSLLLPMTSISGDMVMANQAVPAAQQPLLPSSTVLGSPPAMPMQALSQVPAQATLAHAPSQIGVVTPLPPLRSMVAAGQQHQQQQQQAQPAAQLVSSGMLRLPPLHGLPAPSMPPPVPNGATLTPLDTPTLSSMLHSIELPDLAALGQQLAEQTPPRESAPSELQKQVSAMSDPAAFNPHGSFPRQGSLQGGQDDLLARQHQALQHDGLRMPVMARRGASMPTPLQLDDAAHMRLVSGLQP